MVGGDLVHGGARTQTPILTAALLVVTLVLALALVPTDAQADAVSNEGCTVQVVLEEAPGPHPRVFFDCDFDVTHIEGETNKGAIWPGFQGNPPQEGFLCPDPFSGPMEPPVPGEGFVCGGGPNDQASADVNSDPCGELEPGLFTVTDITFDNRSDPLEPTTATETANVENIVIQGCPGEPEPGPGPADEGGGGGGDTGGEEGRRDDRRDGFGKGKPKGGVEAGFGGAAHPVDRSSSAPLLLGGSGLLLLGLLGGGVTLAARRP
jgi:hypothetical protein